MVMLHLTAELLDNISQLRGEICGLSTRSDQAERTQDDKHGVAIIRHVGRYREAVAGEQLHDAVFLGLPATPSP